MKKLEQTNFSSKDKMSTDWIYNFESLPKWYLHSQNYIYDFFIESKKSNTLFCVYSVNEARMMYYIGWLAIFKNKENPQLVITTKDNIFFSPISYFDDDGDFLFLVYLTNYQGKEHKEPVVVFDISKERFALFETSGIGGFREIFKKSEDVFEIEHKGFTINRKLIEEPEIKEIHIGDLQWYPINRLNDLEEIVYGEDVVNEPCEAVTTKPSSTIQTEQYENLHLKNKCPNCGSPIVANLPYCTTCGVPIASEAPSKDDMINGIKKSDLHLFIDKNSSRYVDVFSANENKKIFLNMNFAALFFNFYWMFYRKMYKIAFVFLAVYILFAAVTSAAVSFAIKPDVDEANEIIEPYSEYYENPQNFYGDYYDGSIDITELRQAENDYNIKLSSIKRKAIVYFLIPSIIFSVSFGLLADWIYRGFIWRNIETSSGGTSGWSLAVGVATYMVCNQVIINPIITGIITKILE